MEWLKLSEGKRDGAEDLKVEPLGEARFKISWGKPTGEGWSGNLDRVYVAAVNKSEERPYDEIVKAERHQGEITLEVSISEPGDEIHFFLFFQEKVASIRKIPGMSLPVSGLGRL